MRTLLTKMFRTPRTIRKAAAPLNIVALEDRSVPAAFTFAGIGFNTDDGPDKLAFLQPATYDGAIVTAAPTSAIAVPVGFPDQAGFPPQSAIGTYFFGGVGSFALNLPAGNDGSFARSGFVAEYGTNAALAKEGRAIANGAGGDMVMYESASSITVPEAFMVQAYNVNQGTWSPWIYQPAAAKSLYVGDPTNGAFATTFDLTDFGFAANDYATKFRVVNMTSEDRMANASRVGVVIPNDGGATSTFTPLPGPLAGFSEYGSTTLDPDPIYFGSLSIAAVNIANVRTTVTVTPATAGLAATYTVLIENLGSRDVTGVQPVFTLDPDFIPSGTTTSANGGATGNTTVPNSDTLTMPAGSSVTYVIDGTVSPDASGTLDSTFDSGLPAAPAVDPNTADNKFISSTGVTVSGDLVAIVTPSSPASFNAGALATYTATITNNGPSSMNGVNITDSFAPAILTGVTFTSVANGGATGNTSGGGLINDTINLPVGGSVIYTISGTSPSDYRGPLDFTFTSTPAAGTSDPTPADGSVTVTGTVVGNGDLFVTNDANPASPISGQVVTYTIVAGNKGPSTVTASVLSDIFNAAFINVNFTSAVTPGVTGNTLAGSGNLNEVLTIDPGASITYTVTAKLASNIIGNVTNSVQIAAPVDFTDPDPSNNEATASINVIPGADVSISVTPNTAIASVGGKMSYAVTVTNNGPQPVSGVTVTSALDPNIMGITFTSIPDGGATGNTGVGTGNINDVLTLPVSSKVVYIISGVVAPNTTGNLTSNFSAVNPPGTPDPNPADNFVTIVTPTQPSPKVIFAASTGLGVTTQVFVFNADGSSRFSYQPYATNFTRGVNVAIGDVNFDGFPDLITGAASGGGSHVRAVNGFDGADLFSFFAYGPVVRTGVVVGCGDINGDGYDDIITGPDTGGGPRVRGFDIKTQGPNGVSFVDFFAFPSNINSGLRVAASNVLGTTIGSITVSAGPNGPAQIRNFNGTTGALLSEFFPFEPTSTRGTWVSAADFDDDGKTEIVVGNDRGTVPIVRVFNPAQNFKQLSEFFAYETNFKGGVRVGVFSDDTVSIANPPDRIVTGPGPGGGPRLRKFTETGGDLGSQFLIGEFDRGGLYVG